MTNDFKFILLGFLWAIIALLMWACMDIEHDSGMQIVYCMERLQDRSMEAYNYCASL